MSQLRVQDERAVAYRALCLGALLKRGELEVAVHNVDGMFLFGDARHRALETQQRLHQQLCDWIESEGIKAHFSDNERSLLEKPLGRWSDRMLTHVGWHVEALGVILWALNRLEDIPAYDQQFELDTVLKPLDIFKPTIDFIWCATLRDPNELGRRRDEAELWNWRSRATELQRMGVHPPEGVTFSEIIRFTTERALAEGKLRYMQDGDFCAFDKAYALLDEDEYALVSAIAYERYSGLSWVCELSSDWESIYAD